jgi:hypothetical protein
MMPDMLCRDTLTNVNMSQNASCRQQKERPEGRPCRCLSRDVRLPGQHCPSRRSQRRSFGLAESPPHECDLSFRCLPPFGLKDTVSTTDHVNRNDLLSVFQDAEPLATAVNNSITIGERSDFKEFGHRITHQITAGTMANIAIAMMVNGTTLL